MQKLDVLFFDVLGTVVDWKRSVAADVDKFLKANDLDNVSPIEFADAWVGKYESSVEAIRAGSRTFSLLDVLNRENLEETLSDFGLVPSNFSPLDVDHLNMAWHRLNPWPDSVEAITRLKQTYIVAPLSDGNTRLLVDMAKHSGLAWDTVVGSDISRAYKPSHAVYRKACELLDVAPSSAMLVAAHDYDLKGARDCGLRTAYIERRTEYAPEVGSEAAGGEWDYRAGSLLALADILTS